MLLGRRESASPLASMPTASTPLLGSNAPLAYARKAHSLEIDGALHAVSSAVRFKRRTTIFGQGKILHKPVGSFGAFLFIR